MNCPSRSAQGLACKFPAEHPGPHKALGELGRTVTWGFRASTRPMYPGNVRPDLTAHFTALAEASDPVRCDSVYVENGLQHQCVKDKGHPGTLHRLMNVYWVG